MGKHSSYRANELSMREQRDRKICGPGYKYIDAIGKCAGYGGGGNWPEKPKPAPQKPSEPPAIVGNKPPQPAAANKAIAKEASSRK